MKAFVVLESKLTGGKHLVVSPAMVIEVGVQKRTVVLIMCGGKRVSLYPQIPEMEEALTRVVKRLFPIDLADRTLAVGALVKRYLNPLTIAWLEFGSMVVSVGRSDGALLQFPRLEFAQYKALAVAIFGSEAAKEILPRQTIDVQADAVTEVDYEAVAAKRFAVSEGRA